MAHHYEVYLRTGLPESTHLKHLLESRVKGIRRIDPDFPSIDITYDLIQNALRVGTHDWYNQGAHESVVGTIERKLVEPVKKMVEMARA